MSVLRFCASSATWILLCLTLACGQAPSFTDKAFYGGNQKSNQGAFDANPENLSGQEDAHHPEGEGQKHTSSESNEGSGSDSDDGSFIDEDGNLVYQASETFQVDGYAKPVDIVLTVDDSGSMFWIQQALSERITSAFFHLQSTDFRLALNTTDWRTTPASSPFNRIRHFIDNKNDQRPFEEKMSDLASSIAGLGILGHGDERGMLQAVRGLKEDHPDGYGPWLRENSVVALLIVTDEDNCSNGLCPCPSNQPGMCDDGVRPETPWVLDQLAGSQINRTPGVDARVYTVMNTGPEVSCPQHRVSSVGAAYQALVDATGGLAGEICEPDYAPVLQRISADIGILAKTTYALAQEPLIESVKVWINGESYEGNIEVSEKAISLSQASLEPGDELKVAYQWLAPK